MAWIVFYPGGRRICHCSLTLAGRGEVSIRGGFLGFQLCPVFLWLTWTLRHPVGSRDTVKELRVDRNGQSWIIRNSRVQDNGMMWGRWEMDDATRVRTRIPSGEQDSWIADVHLLLLSLTVCTEAVTVWLPTYSGREETYLSNPTEAPLGKRQPNVMINGRQEGPQMLMLTGVLRATASEPSTIALVLDLQNQILKVLFLCLRSEPQELSHTEDAPPAANAGSCS